MSKFRVLTLLIPVFLVVMTLAISVSAQADTAAINWYAGGDGKLNLDPIPLDNSSSIKLSGSTPLKTLVVTVAKNNGRSQTNPVPLAADGSFHVRYLIKDGAGTYTIKLSGSRQSGSLSFEGLGFFTYTVKKALPAGLHRRELNDRIINFVDRVMGTTVGRGECWDLAQQALDLNLADWSRPTAFGLHLNPETDEIKAGDIIQFRSVTITGHLPGGVTKRETWGTPDHTAVIYKVLGKKNYILAHQNVGGIRSVITGDINLAGITGGAYRIYRPVALMIRE